MRRGFTLLEVLVALAIVGLAAASVLQLLGTAARNAARAQSTTRAVLVAESLMEELLAASEDELRSRDRSSGERVVPREPAESRGRAAGIPYRWQVRVAPQPEEPGLYGVRLDVRWEEPSPGAVELATLRRFSSPEARRVLR